MSLNITSCRFHWGSREEKEVTRKVRGRLIRLKTEAMAKAELCEDKSCPGTPWLLDESHCTAEGFSLSKFFSGLKPMFFHQQYQKSPLSDLYKICLLLCFFLVDKSFHMVSWLRQSSWQKLWSRQTSLDISLTGSLLA